MTVSDEDLAHAAAGGDSEAFELLLARCYDRLYGVCFRLTGHAAEAEDLTQDICLALPAKLGGFRGEARFSTWLYRVAYNAMIDRRRKAQSYARALTGWSDVEDDRHHAAIDQNETLSWLYTAMTQIPEALRDTLALVLDDLTHAEAGAILGVPEGTVSYRVSEARKRLREIRQKEEAQ